MTTTATLDTEIDKKMYACVTSALLIQAPNAWHLLLDKCQCWEAHFIKLLNNSTFFFQRYLKCIQTQFNESVFAPGGQHMPRIHSANTPWLSICLLASVSITQYLFSRTGQDVMTYVSSRKKRLGGLDPIIKTESNIFSEFPKLFCRVSPRLRN